MKMYNKIANCLIILFIIPLFFMGGFECESGESTESPKKKEKDERPYYDGLDFYSANKFIKQWFDTHGIEYHSLVILYVDCPRDLAYHNYRKSSGRNASLHEFAKVREHPVELELPLLKYDADAFLYNADLESDAVEVLMQWLSDEI